MQGAYDYQFAPRWVSGAFVDADWSDISASAKQSSSSSPTIHNIGLPDAVLLDQPEVSNFNNLSSKTTIDTNVNTDWSISVGGRIGWLASPNTLLYFLAAYTHQDLSEAQVKVNISDPLKGFNMGGLDIVSGNPFSNSPTSLLVKLPDSLDGLSLGGGGEAKLGHGPWSVKLEYRWTHLDRGSGQASSSKFQSVHVGETLCQDPPVEEMACSGVLDNRNIKSNAPADLDVDIQTVRAELVYHFWSGGGGYGG